MDTDLFLRSVRFSGVGKRFFVTKNPACGAENLASEPENLVGVLENLGLATRHLAAVAENLAWVGENLRCVAARNGRRPEERGAVAGRKFECLPNTFERLTCWAGRRQGKSACFVLLKYFADGGLIVLFLMNF